MAGAADDPEHVLRAAALLGLSEAGGLVLLGGRWGALLWVKRGDVARAGRLLGAK